MTVQELIEKLQEIEEADAEDNEYAVEDEDGEVEIQHR